MSDLSKIEKVKLEKLFEMSNGYVINFSNSTFENFVIENTGIDIYDEKYSDLGESKANRLRSFWQKESNYIVGKLTLDLLAHWKIWKSNREQKITDSEKDLLEECYKIGEKLKQDIIIENIDAIQPYSEDENFWLLANSIKESIQKNKPEVALDRLHTFVVKYVRKLCDKYNIPYDKKPLHSLFGEYVNYLNNNNMIESPMTKRILKASVSILQDFNDVRNNQSLAHDNPILNYHESILIFNNITNTIKFIEYIEKENLKNNQEDEIEVKWDNF